MMTSKAVVVSSLVASLLVAGAPLRAQQAQPRGAGTIAGKATDQARQPYADYTVQLRDAATGTVTGTTLLGPAGTFSFTTVDLGRKYLVELYNNRQSRLVCTEGPFALTANAASKTDVNIACGKAPAALWLLAAGAGTAAAVAVAVRSVSQ